MVCMHNRISETNVTWEASKKHMSFPRWFTLGAVLCVHAFGQEAATPGAPTPIDKRAYGVLPNYRTANLDDPFVPLTTKRKLIIASKDSFDYPIFGLAAFFSGQAQLQNDHPQFGQGASGFAKRYGTAFTDQMVGNYMTEGIMPALFHEDPRYFRKGPAGGHPMKRALYAASRVLISKTDKGAWGFNFAEVVGNTAASGVSNLYYPGERTLGDNAERTITQITTDAISNVLKEFWPDVKQRLLAHRAENRQ